MAQHLCIVARDKPLLLGYLNIVLEHLTANGDELQIVIDRRPDPVQIEDPAPLPRAIAPDKRRVRGVDEQLRTRGYALVTLEDGRSWELSDRGAESEPEAEKAEDLSEEDATRAAGSHRALLSALVFAGAVVGVAVALPRDSVPRFADGLVAFVDRGTSWLRAPVDLPPAAPSSTETSNGDGTATSFPLPSRVASRVLTSPAALAALQAARAGERVTIEARG